MNMSSNRRPPGVDLPGSAWGLPRDFEDLLDRFGRWTGWDVGGRPQSARWMPVAEEDETADSYRVRMELPGIPRDQVNVEVEGRQLCVRGDLGEEAGQGDTYLTHRSGSFLYRTSLPADADLDSIQADLKDGVLTVTVPRSTGTGRRTVPIGGTAGDVIAGETTETVSGSGTSSPQQPAPSAQQPSPQQGTQSTQSTQPVQQPSATEPGGRTYGAHPGSGSYGAPDTDAAPSTPPSGATGTGEPRIDRPAPGQQTDGF